MASRALEEARDSLPPSGLVAAQGDRGGESNGEVGVGYDKIGTFRKIGGKKVHA